MPIQRSYRLPHQSPIEAVQIDCGVYLFLMTLCIKNGEHLGMLTPTVVHAARPYLAWSLGIATTRSYGTCEHIHSQRDLRGGLGAVCGPHPDTAKQSSRAEAMNV